MYPLLVVPYAGQGVQKDLFYIIYFYTDFKNFLQGLRSDMFNYVPPKIGLKIFSSVLNDSLSILG